MAMSKRFSVTYLPPSCRNQLREESIRRFGLRLRVGYRLFLVLVATVIGVGDGVRGQYRLENARSVRAWLQSGVKWGRAGGIAGRLRNSAGWGGAFVVAV